MDPLFPYQEALVSAMTQNHALFVAADMGLGKTRCAIEAARRVGAQRVLVIAPAIGRVSWPSEIEKWGDGKTLAVPVASPLELAGSQPDGAYKIVSYGQISRDPGRWVSASRLWKPDAVVIDEAHYLARTGALQNTRTARTSAVYGRYSDGKDAMIEGARFVWPMSGTPVVNHTADLWTHLRALAPQMILSPVTGKPMSEFEFQDRYSTTRVSSYGVHVNGSINTAQLRAATAKFFYRLRKADVLPDLPPILWTHEPLDLTVDDAAKTLVVPTDVSDGDLLEWLEAQSEHVATVRRMLGLAKAAAAISWVHDFLAGSDRKLIVFAHHPEVLETLMAASAAWKPVVVHGGTPTGQRMRAVERFQSDDRCRLFLGQTQACGTSLTLTAASDVAFVEEDWSPMNMAQAAHRALRIGQTRGVLARVLYAPGSLDERIARVAARKASEIDRMFN